MKKDSKSSDLENNIIPCPKCGFDAFFWPRINGYYCSACGTKTKKRKRKKKKTNNTRDNFSSIPDLFN
jgi:ribosomal protein L37E